VRLESQSKTKSRFSDALMPEGDALQRIQAYRLSLDPPRISSPCVLNKRYLATQLGRLYVLGNSENEKTRLAFSLIVAALSGAIIVVAGLAFALVWPL
jgi:hypothetical protein